MHWHTRVRLFLSLAICALAGSFAPSVAAAPPAPIAIDHNAVSLDQLGPARRSAARAVSLYVEHASVGKLISEALDDLARNDPSLEHPKWDWRARGNPGWRAKLVSFSNHLAALEPSAYRVVSTKLCFIDEAADPDVYVALLDRIESDNPDKIFVWWTMPLTTAGSAARDAFNAAVRRHARGNSRVLFDIADIESHDVDGTACTDGGHEALCPRWNADGGHPNAAGSRRLAEGVWRLMDQVAERRPARVASRASLGIEGAALGFMALAFGLSGTRHQSRRRVR
jgi:hypothetical protein